MKTNTSIILKFGLIAGVIISTVLLIGVALSDPSNPDLTMGKVLGYGSMTLAFLVLFPALRQINKEVAYSFGRNLLYALAIIGIATILYSLAWTIYVNFIDPSIVNSFNDYFMKELESQNLSPEEFAVKKEEVLWFADLYQNPLLCFLFTLVEPLPVGIVLAPIAAIFQFKENSKRA